MVKRLKATAFALIELFRDVRTWRSARATGLSHEKDVLVINGCPFTLEFVILESFVVGSTVVVWFDPGQALSVIDGFRNICGYDLQGRLLWRCELPVSESMEACVGLISKDPIIAYTFCGYRCQIDHKTGRIVCREFTK